MRFTAQNYRLASLSCLTGMALITVAMNPGKAWAWGHTGHNEIGEVAAQKLPAEVPSFVRNALGVSKIQEYSAEPDISKTSGNIHDFERDPGHYTDIDDDGLILGTVPVISMPGSRRDFDTALRGAASPTTQYSAGYVYYNIVDGWQQVRKDFAYYRAFLIGLRGATNDDDRAFFNEQLKLRIELTLRDVGYWAHFVEDASQPMHVSIHFNGWGNYPNPNNYTNAPIHAPFEGSFVKANTTPAAVAAGMESYVDCHCAIESRTALYLLTTVAAIPQTYQLAGPSSNYTVADPAAVKFVNARLSAGASQLRDMIVDAWRSSATWVVGFPLINVQDIISGKVKVNRTSFWSD